MVGAPKSNRCDTCRKRKVKCDEDWPICGPCKRGNRTCPPRPSLRVVDDGQKLSLAVRDKSPPSAGQPASSKQGESRVGSPISLTPSEQLAFELVTSLQADNLCLRLCVVGEFVWEVPRHLGKSDALDDMTKCMLSTHTHLLRHGNYHSHQKIHPQLYSRALQGIRSALADPKRCFTSETLAAVVLLHRFEAMFGTFPNYNLHVHASGLATLLQKKGPPDPRDKLEFQATVDSHLSIMQGALAERRDCFLTSAEWGAVLDEQNGRSEIQMLHYRLIRLITFWPALTREYSMGTQPGGEAHRDAAWDRCLFLLDALSRISIEVAEILNRPAVMGLKPPSDPRDPIPLAFDVRDRTAAFLACHHAMYSMAVHRTALTLIDDAGGREGDRDALRVELMRQCRRAWMLIDYGLSYRPLGLPVLSPALTFTYDLAETPEARQFIIEAITELEEFRYSEQYWDAERVRQSMHTFLGEGVYPEAATEIR